MIDLLQRKQQVITFDHDHYRGKKVIVTGAAGSIGSAVVCELADIARITCVDANEHGLFQLQREYRDQDFRLMRIQELTLRDIEQHDLVIHTAAYKHVGMSEHQADSAIKNNVGATANLAGLCHQANRHFCFISTDKAVEPAGVMGRSKYVAERCVDAWRHIGLKMTMLRFANVLGSSGSVLEVWENEEEEIAVTSEEMKRWFITPREAATGILRAIQESDRDRYLFAIRPGEETRIIDLARRYALQNSKEVRVSEPVGGEKTAETFCYENQFLEKIEGFLYAIRRSDVPDSVCQPGKILPSSGYNEQIGIVERSEG